ncbi:hypothetical protein ACRQFT_08710 [Actinotignum sp. GS-2025b]|uniref:hypothetical protein n=1 Tax=Actinotignum sp. GS-2025b TaxID=3427275 RepID=UPI003F4478F0
MSRTHVRAFRDHGWWGLELTVNGEIYHSQARRLNEISDIVADALNLLNVENRGFDLVIDVGSTAETIARAKKLSRQAHELQSRASQATREAATSLRSSGVTVREVAEIMELSPGRISKILQTA